MIVAVFSTSYLPQSGGAERFVFGLASQLASEDDVVLIAPITKASLVPAKGCRVIAIRGLGLFSPLSGGGVLVLMINLLIAFMRTRFTIVQVVGLYPAGYAAVLLRTFFPFFAVSVRATGSDIQVDHTVGYGLRRNPIYDRLIRWTLRRADALVANSASIADEMHAAGADAERVHIISNGVEVERFQPLPPERKADIRRKYTGNDRARIILSVGRVEPRKNYEFLLQAFTDVVDHCPNDVYCVIVGSGTEKLHDLVASLDIRHRVIFAGRIPAHEGVGTTDTVYPAQELVDLYRASTLFAFPSVREGQPNVLLEAAAAGLPVVACDVQGSRDVVREGETGFLVPEGDAGLFAARMVTLLENKVRFREMSNGARAVAQLSRWEQVGEHYRSLFEKLRV